LRWCKLTYGNKCKLKYVNDFYHFDKGNKYRKNLGCKGPKITLDKIPYGMSEGEYVHMDDMI